MVDTMIAQMELKVKTWEEMSQHERWLLDPHRAGRQDAAGARARYKRVGGQANYVLLANARLYLDTAEFFADEHPALAKYYLGLVKERIQMLEARIP